MQKIYSRINWENFPSEKTAVNESNLNKMDLAIDNLDDRVVAMDASKVDLTRANELVEEILWDESNGTLTVVKMNGSRAVIDTKLEKLAVNFTYNPQTQQLVITLDDGTVQNVDLSSLITEYEFLDSDTIAFEIAGGKVKAIVKNGSITEDHLSPDYLGEIRTQVGRAEMSAKSADASEKNAASSSALAKSYAVGGTGTRDGEDTDNAKYYMEQAKALSAVDIATTEKAGIVKPDGTTITIDEDGTLHGVAEVTVDDALSSTSTNPVQNKVVTNEFNHQSTEMMDIKMLGWAVPRECPIQNEINGNQFVQKVGRLDTGRLSWYYIKDFTAFRFASSIDGYLKYGIKQYTFLYLYGFNYIGILDVWSDIIYANEKSIAGVWAGGGDDGFIIKNTDYTDAESFKQAMQGQYLYYELATPITKTIDGNEIGETVSDVRKETTVNLFNPTLETTTKDGITCTNNGDGTYTLNGTATDNVFFDINKNIPINKGTEYKAVCFKDEDYVPNKILSCVRRVDTTDEYVFNNGSFVSDSENCWLLVTVAKDVTVSNLVAKPMLTTNLSATYDDFVPYTGDTGRLNGDVAELKAQSVKKDDVVNNQTTTEEGFVLDARQANPNIDGSLAKQISDLNGSLSNTFITSNMNVGMCKQLCFDFSAVEQIVFMWFFYPLSMNSVSLYVVEHHEDSKLQLISATNTGYNPKIVNSNGKVSISFDNNYMGYMMFSTSKLDITVC